MVELLDDGLEVFENKRQPFTSAPISLIISPQGGGKSTILTARAIDDTFAHITSIKLENGYEVKASPAYNERKSYHRNGYNLFP